MLIMGNCISCKESLTNTEIIAFDNMPAAAQHMPDKEQVKKRQRNPSAAVPV